MRLQRLRLNRFFLLFMLCFLQLFTACGKSDISTLPLVDKSHTGRQAWKQLAEVKSLKADAILSWKTTGGEHGKYRVRLFLEPPENLKIQWLTPWGSVAGELLIADNQFWLTNAGKRQTWHGTAANIESLLQKNGEHFQIVASLFFKYWSLLFSLPEDDDKNFSGNIFIEYLALNEEKTLSFSKIITSLSGDEIHFRLLDFEKSGKNQLMPQTVEILSRSGRIGIKFRSYSLQPDLSPGTFIYSLKNFKIYESL